LVVNVLSHSDCDSVPVIAQQWQIERLLVLAQAYGASVLGQCMMQSQQCLGVGDREPHSALLSCPRSMQLCLKYIHQSAQYLGMVCAVILLHSGG
jgi:hypothetical protein